MGRVDSLSKRVDWTEGVKRDNENQVMLKKEWLEVRAMEQLIEGPEEKIVKKIKKARDKDEKVINTPIAGHGGQQKTVELVTRNYW